MKRKQSTGAQRWGQVHVEILKNCGGLPRQEGYPIFSNTTLTGQMRLD